MRGYEPPVIVRRALPLDDVGNRYLALAGLFSANIGYSYGGDRQAALAQMRGALLRTGAYAHPRASSSRRRSPG
jgi:hypothetical protein